MDLRSMSDKKFVSYRTNFFTEIKDWTPEELAKGEEIIKESNRRLAMKRLQIKKPGGLNTHLPDDLLEKIATSSPLKAKSVRTKRKKRRRKRRTKKKTKSSREI